MYNEIGKKIKLSFYGKSHDDFIIGQVENMPKGIQLDYDYINFELEKRRPDGIISTQRIEHDEYDFISGIENNITTGEKLVVKINNTNIDSSSYNNLKGIARPSHADYTNFKKNSSTDLNVGGGIFSGRLTVVLVLLGAIFKKELENNNIFIGTHVSSVAGFNDENLHDDILEYCKIKNINIESFNDKGFNNYITFLKNKIEILNNKKIGIINDDIKNNIVSAIKNIKEEKDSLAGILETMIVGLKPGIGNAYFDGLEGLISNAIFSIPGVKGVLFGNCEKFSCEKGSEFNDNFRMNNNTVWTLTNNNAGINGGISNGMPIFFKTFIKPTPSIGKKQKTIDFINNKNVEINLDLRSDPCICHRIRVVVDNLLAFLLYDEMYE